MTRKTNLYTMWAHGCKTKMYKTHIYVNLLWFCDTFFLRRGVVGDMVMAGTEVKDGGRSGSGLCFSGL